jgi:hypothetical protein
LGGLKETAMTEGPRKSAERISAEQAPEVHNAEQDDEHDQAHEVASEAFGKDDEESPLDSEKPDDGGDVMDDASQDLIDRMRDMEQSGRVDMSAYRGEPNMDDEDETYGADRPEDDESEGDLPSDGS